MRKRVMLSIFAMMSSFLVFWLTQPSLTTSFLTSLLFWGGLFVLTYTLIGNIFVKNKIFYITLGVYLTFHLFIFGIYFVALSGFVSGFYAGIGYNVYTIRDLWSFVNYISFSPAIFFFIGNIEVDVMPVIIYYGTVIGSLLGYGFSTVKGKKKVLGVVGGISLASASTCCASVPTIIAVAVFSSDTSLLLATLRFFGDPIGYALIFYILPTISVFAIYHITSTLRKASFKKSLKELRIVKK
ncbi:hypothetical protein [Saccharolobus shibatae]|uniref:Uncharacterized protein n=1 Tax=Saccharolobus shibatae TaxID=2286 RepID=A0A8F5GZP1_9CREN|nr:hypothetical protein [Saccharolobus shibatae]QXJ35311.1 hypothetical protein J5U22_01858 [Saccharolobus shibatae]